MACKGQQSKNEVICNDSKNMYTFLEITALSYLETIMKNRNITISLLNI